MSRMLRVVVVLLLVALIPARAMGAVTLGACLDGQDQAVVQHDADEPTSHAHPFSPEGGHTGYESGHSCGYCAAHCVGAAFVVPADAVQVSPRTGADLIPFGRSLVSAFLPDLLDRPPLAP